LSQGFAYDPNSGLIGKTPVEKFGSLAAAVPSTETVITTYTVPASTTANLKGVFGEGGSDGLFILYVNSVALWRWRNAWTQRGTAEALDKALVAGDIVDLKVTNQKTTNQPFSGGFYVYEL